MRNLSRDEKPLIPARMRDGAVDPVACGLLPLAAESSATIDDSSHRRKQGS